MSDLILSEPLASQIRREAAAQGVNADTLIEEALRHYRFKVQKEKIRAESAWWQSCPPETRAGYGDEYVAIHNQQVIDHDSDEETLRKRIRARYGKTAVLITPAAGQPELRMISTRWNR
ncbi:MAG: DUF5678 domain-containing protein [Chloroflexota bacterium]